MYLRRETRGERTVRVAGTLGLCLAGVVLWLAKAPDTRDVSDQAVVRNYATVAVAALVAARESASAQCASTADRADRAQDAQSALASAKLASAALAKASLPDSVRTIFGRLDGRLGWACQRYAEWSAKCEPASLPELQKYDEDLTIDLEAFRNPTGFGSGMAP